ncbi:hypothetical protein O1611_g604 [Lasiodiplodia mahajangana]|uniref:Uncharacterized protein n=1 Tax=Lasiodiplodia mahajangana TaxID=1108764 RepID=A0ACC2K007_9PEZI|nr:hypothetical protein O1611_g604 [Lasiodiplodia mahajangana]
MPRSRQNSFSPRAVGGRKFVAFFHPAYSDSAPPLLTLAAVDWFWDSWGSRRKVRGIQYETALTACGIVACNRWDGYFAMKHEKRGEPVRWIPVYNSILRVGAEYTYYFIINSPNYRYPVVPSFDHWRFPHDNLPPRWGELSKFPSMRCCTTKRGCDSDDEGEGDCRCAKYEGYSTCFKQTPFASVAPFTHESWYESNQMEKYCRLHGVGDTTVSDLFLDITKYFGRGKLRTKPWGHSSSRYELHPELILRVIFSSYHPLSKKRDHATSPVHAAGIHREHIFARFAFHVLSDANYRFLGGDRKYTVCLFDAGKGEQCTAELRDDDIAERSQIFPHPTYPRAKAKEEWSAVMTPRKSREIMESFESDEEGVTEEEYDYPSDASEYRPSRPRYRVNHQNQIDGTREWESKADEIRTQHGGSSRALSISSTISSSSLDTPHPDRASEDAVDKPNKSSFSARQKRSYESEEEDSEENPPPLKRLRVI